MKKSLIAVALTLLTTNLYAEIVTQSYDSEPLTAVDSEGNLIESEMHEVIIGENGGGVSRRVEEITIDGKVVAHREQNFELPFNTPKPKINNSKEETSKKKVNS